ncbi:hypothetical protein ACLI1A_09285 [Flavobacterium sp. RHBU_3]|uniref:hypothetical protein n=1 Tax=Flavobacterium sp. RHBU_3 TaxID=3391184 RepID=UPI003984F15F
METTTNELVKLFRERLKYPIITVYSILLIIYNWDVLAVFCFSDKAIEERIKYINDSFADPYYSRLWCPLIKAIAVSLLAPTIMWGLEFVLKLINSKRQKIKDARNTEILLGKLQNAKLEFQIEEEKSGKRSLEELNKIIMNLENDLNIVKLDSVSHLDSEREKNTELTRLLKEKEDKFKEIESKYQEVSHANQRFERESAVMTKEVSDHLKSLYGDVIFQHTIRFLKSFKDGFDQMTLARYFDNEGVPLNDLSVLLSRLQSLNLIFLFQGRGYILTEFGKVYLNKVE